MRAFVIRGFGPKAGVDFERVHTELIAPALQQVGVEGGGTTGDILEAGNVREDIFRELVLADVVVADVSLANANVFYELGIRHAVRNRSTVLIRARIDEVPFDLRTDRYLSYDPVSAAASVPQLVQVLRETLASERTDSPVFQLLPGFAAGPRATLLDLPRDLAEDIEQARDERRAGDLRLIAEEVVGLRFEEAALRAVAQALTDVGDDVGAQRPWERIRAVHPDDLEAKLLHFPSHRGAVRRLPATRPAGRLRPGDRTGPRGRAAEQPGPRRAVRVARQQQQAPVGGAVARGGRAEPGPHRASVPGAGRGPPVLPARLRRGAEPLVLGPERPRPGQDHLGARRSLPR